MLFELIASVIVTVTTYNPCPEQGWGSGKITASGDMIKGNATELRWVALSRDFFKRGVKFNDVVIIDGKRYIVKDKMNKRYTNRIDILQDKRDKNYKLTNKKIKVYARTSKKSKINRCSNRSIRSI